MNTRNGLFHIRLNQFDLDFERFRRPKESLVKKMIQSLKQQGQLSPVIVSPKNSNFLMVDGFKRYQAAITLGWKSLNAIDIETDNQRAKAMVYLMNQSSSFNMIQEAILIKELVELDGLTQNETAILLGRHKSWISRRLDIIRRLTPEVIETILIELIPDGAVSSLARIPACNQVDFSCAIQNHQLEPNEIRLLTDIFCKTSDPGIRKSILKSPREALQIVKKQANSKTITWLAKIQLMIKTITMLEKHIGQNKHRIPEKTISHLMNNVDQVKPVLAQILMIIQKESQWED